MKNQRKTNMTIGKTKRYLKYNSSTILTFTAAVGVIVTTVSAVKVTPKALALLKEAEKEKGEPLTKGEKVLRGGAVYIPIALIGVTTIVCIFGANTLNKRQQAMVTSAYAMLDQSYKKYKGAVTTIYGEEAEQKIQAEMAQNVYISVDGLGIPDLQEHGDLCLFYESYSMRYFTATMAFVLNAQYHLNRNFALGSYVTINQFYEFLGLEKEVYGDVIGWDIDELVEMGLTWIDFETYATVMEDGVECFMVSAVCEPSILCCGNGDYD